MVEFEMYSVDFLRDYLGFTDEDICRAPFYLFTGRHQGRLIGNNIVYINNACDTQYEFDSKMCRIIKIAEG